MSGDPKQMWDFTATTTVPATSRIPIMLEGPLSRHITGANLITSIRDQLFNRSVYVAPSGDETGETDRINIQAAVDAFIAATGSNHELGTVYLSGMYYIDTQLTLGDTSYEATTPGCNLVGLSTAYIKYAGDTASTYLLEVGGYAVNPRVKVDNLFLDCNYKCRGINWRTPTYSKLSNVTVFKAIEVGVDANGVWTGKFENVYCWYTDGIGMRLNTCNAMILDHIQIDRGLVANFPAVDDTTVQDHADANLVTADDNRGALVVDSSKGCVFRGLTMQLNLMDAYPMISIVARSCRHISFREFMHFESNASTSKYVYLDGSSLNTSAGGYSFLFEEVNLASAIGAIPFILGDGYLDMVRVDGIFQGAAGTAPSSVIEITDAGDSSGHLYRASVTGARLGIIEDNQIVASSTATIETTKPYSRDYQSVE